MPYRLLTAYQSLLVHKYAFRPICCLHFGPVSKEKQHFVIFGGHEEDLMERKMQKNCTNFGTLFGRFYDKISLK